MQETEKLHEVLPDNLRSAAPFCLLLANRLPARCAEYGLAFWVALELPAEMKDKFLRYSSGRSGF